MDNIKGKMRFLAIKLAALKSELKISKEIFQSASREVEQMFNKKYFPEVPVAVRQEPTQEQKIKEYSEQEASSENLESEKQQQETNHNSENKEKQDKLPSSASVADPEVKKMFKKIATKIHPDKLAQLEDGYEKQKKQELFEKARAALEDNDILILADVAIELDIDVPEITAERLKQAENKIIAIKKELNHIESTMVWHWFFTEDKQQKDQILKKLFEIMYASNVRP